MHLAPDSGGGLHRAATHAHTYPADGDGRTRLHTPYHHAAFANGDESFAHPTTRCRYAPTQDATSNARDKSRVPAEHPQG